MVTGSPSDGYLAVQLAAPALDFLCEVRITGAGKRATLHLPLDARPQSFMNDRTTIATQKITQAPMAMPARDTLSGSISGS